jgi:hypothetical protein
MRRFSPVSAWSKSGLFLFAAIGLIGGALQMYLGQPQTTPRLDNVHRFKAGAYFGTAIIGLWAGKRDDGCSNVQPSKCIEPEISGKGASANRLVRSESRPGQIQRPACLERDVQ